MEEYKQRQLQRRRRRERQRRRRRRRLVLLLVLIAVVILLWRLPRRSYTAQQLGLPTLLSTLDADGDGIDDFSDIMQGARAYIQTHPHYESRYYDGGYPDDGCGVCTDVVWQAFRSAGYPLKELVDADIAARPDAYAEIAVPDPNIDFRRVENLDVFFRFHAKVLPCTFDDLSQWQPGDIVVFDNGEHIAICSDKRNRDGIPWIIHHGNPLEEAVEADQMGRMTVTGHYRWLG